MATHITKDVYYIGMHPHCFRAGEPAKVKGVCWVVPDDEEGRACFRLKYADGFEDEAPISDAANYRLVDSVRKTFVERKDEPQ